MDIGLQCSVFRVDPYMYGANIVSTGCKCPSANGLMGDKNWPFCASHGIEVEMPSYTKSLSVGANAESQGLPRLQRDLVVLR